jgi:hypothetical protein
MLYSNINRNEIEFVPLRYCDILSHSDTAKFPIFAGILGIISKLRSHKCPGELELHILEYSPKNGEHLST